MNLQLTIGDIAAVVALLLSGYAIWTTQRFNKRQLSLIRMQEDLARVQLEQEASAASDSVKADVGAKYTKLGNSRYKLKLFNRGKAHARNVLIEFPDNDSPVPLDELREKLPMEVLAQHDWVDLIAAVHMQTPPKIRAIVRWDDDHAIGNEKTVYLTL